MRKIMDLLSDGRSRTAKEITALTGFRHKSVQQFLADLIHLRQITACWTLKPNSDRDYKTYKRIAL